MIAVLVVALLALAALFAAGVWYRRRRAQLRHDKLLENPLYGIRNLQMAAAAHAAQRQAKQDNRLNTMTALGAPPSAKTLSELGMAKRALPNDYSAKGISGSISGSGSGYSTASGSGSESGKERLYAHVYDTPRQSNVYDVPSSREAYSVPRSSYEIPPAPVKVRQMGIEDANDDGNVYEEVRSTRHRDEDMDGYLVPSQRLKM